MAARINAASRDNPLDVQKRSLLHKPKIRFSDFLNFGFMAAIVQME